MVDLAIHRDYHHGKHVDLTGFQLDLWLPEGVRPNEWRRGEPDCGFIGFRFDVHDPHSPYRSTSVFLPEGCDPAADCRGIRVLATVQSRLETWPRFVCRARIDSDLAPGSYPMSVENLYLETAPQSDRLQAVVGDVYVLADRRAPTPTPDSDLDYYGPTPAPIPKLLLHGSGVETTAGWTSDIEFKLSGSALAPLVGDLRAVIAMEQPLRPVANGTGGVLCRRNPDLSNGGTFELLPSGCALNGGCTGVAVQIKVDPGFVDFDSGDPPSWYFQPDTWLFRCEIAVAEDGEDGQYYVRLSQATLGGRAIETRDVLVDAFVPWFTPPATTTPRATNAPWATPTATATPRATNTYTATPTPSPRGMQRPCVAEEGTSIICIDDLEARAGDAVEITVHYLSGGLRQAGLEFIIDLGTAFAPIPDDPLLQPHTAGRCRINPDVNKSGGLFYIRDNRIKALIVSLVSLDPLPDDARLLTCTLDVAADLAPGEYEIALLEPGGSDPSGKPLPVATSSGFLRIRGTVAPSVIPRPLPQMTAATREATSTPQANARDIAAARDDSGCQLVEPRLNDWAVAILLMLPPVLWLRRCSAAVRG